MLVKIKDILPNPFRNIEHYPINREKVETLKASFDRTEFWDNILGRERKGKVELAYGHHRWIALKEHYGLEHTVNITTRNLSDADMIVIMAGENMDEWATSAIVEIETVEAVVKAFAEGKIKLPKVDGKARKGSVRYAPSFIPDVTLGESHMPYTAQSVGDFLGWVKPKDGAVQAKVHTALTALQYIEEGISKLSDFENMGSKGIEAVVRQAAQARAFKESQARVAAQRAEYARKEIEEAKRREEKARAEAEKYRKQRRAEEERRASEEAEAAKREREEHIRTKAREEADAATRRKEGREVARKVTAAVSKHIQSGGGTKTAPDAAIKAVPKHDRQQPDLQKYLRDALREVDAFLTYKSPVHEDLHRVLEYKDSLDEDALDNAKRSLLSLSKRAATFAEEFTLGTPVPKNSNHGRLTLKN